MWTLLESADGENFSKTASKRLKLKLSARTIHPVYDYVAKGKKHYIVYAEVKTQKNFPATKNFCFAWFDPKEVSKLPLSAQTKQDIIVGHRVIDSLVRQNTGG